MSGTEEVGGSFWEKAADSFLDVQRSRFIDTEDNYDTTSNPDRADLGDAKGTGIVSRPVAGLPLWAWGAGLVGAAFLFKLAR